MKQTLKGTDPKLKEVLDYINDLSNDTEKGSKAIKQILKAVVNVACFDDIRDELNEKECNIEEEDCRTIKELLKQGFTNITAYYEDESGNECEVEISNAWTCPKQFLDQYLSITDIYHTEPNSRFCVVGYFNYTLKEINLYYEYRCNWCIERGYNPDAFDYEYGENGEAPVCISEWYNNEYQEMIDNKSNE